MIVTLLVSTLLAQAAPEACPAVAAPPAGLSGWSDISPSAVIGKRFTVTGKAGIAGLTAAENARAGLAAIVPIEVKTAGTYSIALSDAAWIDIKQGSTTLTSTSHDHGPACTGIRKIVRYTLAPGIYQMRLSGMKAATIGVLVAAS
jgi:hypothetical protein